MKNTTIKHGPLQCWDIYSQFLSEQANAYRQKEEITLLEKLKKQYQWDISIAALLKDKPYDALVLTDTSQEILWVNKGFTKMTGYPANFAIGKKPSFLQGKETSLTVKEKIRQQLHLAIPFSETIVNYRKNGEIYHCEVAIYPIKNIKNQITHLIALEHEVYDY